MIKKLIYYISLRILPKCIQDKKFKLSNVDAVLYDTDELKDMIKKLTQNEGWKFGDFATFA